MPELVSEAQLRQIYGETIDALYGYASRRCGGQRELAEDVTQEVWLRAVREWRTKGVPRVPLAWLTAVARNLILNHLRRDDDVPLARLTGGGAKEAEEQEEDEATQTNTSDAP